MRIVTVYTADFELLSVKIKNRVFDYKLFNTDFCKNCFVGNIKIKAVKKRFFIVPEDRVINFNFDFVVLAFA